MASAIFRAVKEYKIELESLILESQNKTTYLNNKNQLFYSIQFLSSKSSIDIEDLSIPNKDLIYQFDDNNKYQYTYGKVETLKEVNMLKKQLISYGFQDCFTVAILNGEKMSLSDALSILN